MPVTDVQQDLNNLTLTITDDFAAPVQRIWQVYADPRQLEKVLGAGLQERLHLRRGRAVPDLGAAGLRERGIRRPGFTNVTEFFSAFTFRGWVRYA